MIAFGPVPSRRLGFSLGINHIPPKNCPYSCVYCQVGRTEKYTTRRQAFYPPEQIMADVAQKVAEAAEHGRKIDYLTLVPDGEPALDINLKTVIRELKTFNIPIAVISNASLIGQEAVQQALLQADWVSLKVDALQEKAWKKVNRPHRDISLPEILDGIYQFGLRFTGQLVTESMLVDGINDHDEDLQSLVEYLQKLRPSKAYLAIPTRPPAEKWVKPPAPERLQQILQFFSGKVDFLDLLFEAEVDDFAATGRLEEDIVSIISVHPIREEALRDMVVKSGAAWSVIDAMLDAKQIVCLDYQTQKFYLRNFRKGLGT
ncbi:MAG TPA: radical SAM protein [Anaerolineaceae bacterium]|nr:radical SAM protein [Anaerolineaceae bacterium]HPC05884.1 radical SAM protein [Anaerolineaceae bacterium]HQP08393.1 radical SAM protein [Anaerolineaceae bacterium]